MNSTNQRTSLSPACQAAVAHALPTLPKLLMPMDWDATLALPDVISALNDQFGSCDPDGTPMYIKWRQQHAAGELSIREHLGLEFADVFQNAGGLEPIVDYLLAIHRLVPGCREYLDGLRDAGIQPLVISNGAGEIAGALMKHHGVILPKISNRLHFPADHHVPEFHTLSGDCGVDKGAVIEHYAELGSTVLGFCGDSTGDITGAMAAARLGAPVFCCGEGGLAAWCRANEKDLPGGWHVYDDLRDVLSIVLERVPSCSQAA